MAMVLSSAGFNVTVAIIVSSLLSVSRAGGLERAAAG
jgi:hypothetical protein